MIEKMKVKSDEEIKKMKSAKEEYIKINKKSVKVEDLLKRIEILEKLHDLN